MKLYASIVLAAAAALMGPAAVWAEDDNAAAEAAAAQAKFDATIEYYGNSENLIVDRGMVLGDEGERLQRVPVNGTVYVFQEVLEEGGTRRRKLQDVVRKNDHELPFPANGAEIEKNDNAAVFQDDTTQVSVEAFVFTHSNPEVPVVVATEGIILGNGVAEVMMGGFALGEWTWYVKGTNATGGASTSSPQTFTVIEPIRQFALPAEGGTSTAIIGEASYPSGGQVQQAAGRIYYSSKGRDYACSGTAIYDNKSGRSLILTAAHCVWDDIDQNFGSNVIFIPNRDAVGASFINGKPIHRQCSEDVCGCWTLSAGFVDSRWKTLPWPKRLSHDYGIWVVDDQGFHQGKDCGSEALDIAVPAMDFKLGIDLKDQRITGLGYSIEHNPDFRYCADNAIFRKPSSTSAETYWLDKCGLTGGASGGPWLSDFDSSSGSGTVVSVNSWGYSSRSGMGGPIIDASAGRCLVNAARAADFKSIYVNEADGFEGVFVPCAARDCVDEEGAVRRLRGQRKLSGCQGDEDSH